MDAPDPMDNVLTRRQCSAISKQSGQRCRRAPARGQTTCHYHGAASPQAQRCARERLLELLDPALLALKRALEGDDIAGMVRASQIVLDRTGHGPAKRLELDIPEPFVSRVELRVVDPALAGPESE